MDYKIENATKWEPELTERGKAHLEELRRTVAPQVQNVSLTREIRSVLGYSQVELADILGVSQSAVSKIESRDDPTLSTLSKMASAKGKRLRLIVESVDDQSEDNTATSFAVP